MRAPAFAVAVAACTAIAAPAFAQDEAPAESPAVEAAPVEPPVVQPALATTPALVAQQAAPAAAVRDTPGIDFAARVGYARPFGTSFSASAVNQLGDLVSSAVPLALEAGVRANAGLTHAGGDVRLSPRLAVGPYVSL